MNIQEIISRGEYQPISTDEMCYVVESYIQDVKKTRVNINRITLMHPFEISKLAQAFEYAALHFSKKQ